MSSVSSGNRRAAIELMVKPLSAPELTEALAELDADAA